MDRATEEQLEGERERAEPVTVHIERHESIEGFENNAYNSDSTQELNSPTPSTSSSSCTIGSAYSGSVKSLESDEIVPVDDADSIAKPPVSDLHVEGEGGCCAGRCGCCGVTEVLSSRLRTGVDDVREFAGEVGELCAQVQLKQRARKCCSLETLRNKLPIIKWLPKYRLRDLQGDLVAGITVGLTVIPQGIAYAQIAGLDSQYGLYSSFVGCFVYALLGTSKDITIGPVAIMSLLTAIFAKSPIAGDATYAIIVALIGGAIQLAMGIFCIGFVIEYISHPVINSFTTASAITIMESQFKKWLGLKGLKAQGFLEEIIATLQNIAHTRLWDFLLGIICIILLHILKKVKDTKFKNSKSSRLLAGLQYTIWLIGTARNAVIVFLAGTASVIFVTFNMRPFSSSNNMPPGLPPFKVPEFTLYVPAENRTISTTEIFTKIGAGFGIIPLLGVLESIAIAKSFAKRHGYRIDADQELIALGVANILGAFVSAYPATGSFSRTAVNSQSGVRTPLGGVFTGLLVILSLLFLTPYFNYIPDAALAAVIISAVSDLVDFSLLPKLWRVKKIEIFPWVLTFILSLLLGVEYAIIIGVAVTLLMLLYPWNRPVLKVASKEVITGGNFEQATNHQVIVMTINQGIMFPGIEHLKDKVAEKDGIVNNTILDFSHVANIDYTTIEGLSHLISEYTKAGSTLVVSNPQPEILVVLEKARLKDFHWTSTVEDGMKIIKEMEIAKQKAGETLNELVDGGLLERYDMDVVTLPEQEHEYEQEQEMKQHNKSIV